MLPDVLWAAVYEFENTKCDLFAEVLHEFNTVNRFWYLDFLNQPTMTSPGMRITHNEALKLNIYWNTNFINQTYMSQHTKEEWMLDGTVCVPIHEVDTNGWSRIWNILQMNIKSYEIVRRKGYSM